MNELHAIREMYRHHDWAAQRLIAQAKTLDDARLDRRFEMGFGSLRNTLWHNAGVHHVWMRRIHGESPAQFNVGEDNPTIEELESFWDTARQEREKILQSIKSDPELGRKIEYRDMQGNAHTSTLGEILLHVANHAQHHNAQASNMLRHVGGKSPRLDYIFMVHESAPNESPRLSTKLLRDYFAYTDWARDRAMSVVAELDDATLDRSFEIGIGSIRKNMTHTHDAESWWLINWTKGPADTFPKTDDATPIADLRQRFDETSASRNEYLRRLRDEDLARPIEARGAPGKTFTFPLGVTMLQICNHGTHHRAQTINMLRQCGKSAPRTDYIIMMRERAGAQPM